jgi:hypothetical protein
MDQNPYESPREERKPAAKHSDSVVIAVPRIVIKCFVALIVLVVLFWLAANFSHASA